jgi:hypothetical protein
MDDTQLLFVLGAMRDGIHNSTRRFQEFKEGKLDTLDGDDVLWRLTAGQTVLSHAEIMARLDKLYTEYASSFSTQVHTLKDNAKARMYVATASKQLSDSKYSKAACDKLTSSSILARKRLRSILQDGSQVLKSHKHMTADLQNEVQLCVDAVQKQIAEMAEAEEQWV